MARPSLSLGELIEHWTVVGNEVDLVSAKHQDTRLTFALPLKFYGRYGRFPRSRGELHPDAVEFVARAVRACPASVAAYDWSGRTIERCSSEEIEAVVHAPRLDGHLSGSREALVPQEAGQPVELARVVVRVSPVAAGRELQPGAGVTLDREPPVPGQQPDPVRAGIGVPPDCEADAGVDVSQSLPSFLTLILGVAHPSGGHFLLLSC